MFLEVLNRVNLDRGNKGKRYLHACERLYIFYSVFIELFYNLSIHRPTSICISCMLTYCAAGSLSLNFTTFPTKSEEELKLQ